MYESFYGLKEKPFTLLPDPDYLYLSPKHQRALTLLEYGMMNQAGFSVICGDTGAGKTTLIRRLLSELGDDTTVGLITNTHQSFGELLNWVLVAFGLDGEGLSKAQMHQVFIDFLIEQYAQNKHTVLIVDEAQNMSAETLEELRMLSNINADKDQVLQVILAGQPALRETLRQPELMQFAQRIAVDYYLEALSLEETNLYIKHRLHIAGAENQIFSDEACAAIFKYSGGTPRLINLLCDTSLVYGFAEQSEIISEQLVHDVVREQHSNSIIPTFNTNQPHATDDLPPAQPAEQISQDELIQQKVEAALAAQKQLQEKQAQQKQAQQTQKKSRQTEDEVIAELAKRAVSAVSNAEQAAAVATTQPNTQLNHVEATESQTTVDSKSTANEEAVESSNVTPINPKQASSSDQVAEEKAEQEIQTDTEAELEEPQEQPVQAGESLDDAHKEHAAGATSAAHKAHGKGHSAEDVYPIVHIEDNPKKGLNMMIIGLAAGMFIASIAMMVVAWMLFKTQGNVDLAGERAVPAHIEAQLEKERLELELIQKERDAALAVSKALERERDAALQAAKVQEEIRAAELRAAEILAEQEAKAEARLRDARARARVAEKAEARARAREREMQRKTQLKAEELEKQRIEALRMERERLEKETAKQAVVKENSVKPESPAKPQVEVVKQKVEEKKVEEKKDKEKSFTANPCNSPSAKFLSTCKK